MENYKTIEVKNKEYYSVKDIYNFDKLFFSGCSNGIRAIINRKKINKNDYLFAYTKKGELILSNSKYCKAKLYLSKEWCIDHVPCFAKNSRVVAEYEKLPPVVELEEGQKFVDDEEYEYPITMRGSRDYDNCYFKVSDVGDLFGLKDLVRVLKATHTNYKKNTHYKIFTHKQNNESVNKQSKNKIYKSYYFTYPGLIRCLYVSKSKHAESFQQWANKILFTHQFGSTEEKQNLSSKLLGVHANTIREVFNTSTKAVPCVYLFTLGTVKVLRKSMNLSKTYTDDMIICKYGRTDSLERRAYEHNRTFSKIKNVNLCLKYYAYIDPQFASNAETDIADYFQDINANITYENLKELVILSPKQFEKSIKQQYTNLSTMYAGHISDLLKKITELENQLLLKDAELKNQLLLKDVELKNKDNDIMLQKEQYKNQLKDRDIEMKNKDIEMINKDNLINEEKYKNQLKDKDIELLQLKLQLATMKK